jgi:hypothetical protein
MRRFAAAVAATAFLLPPAAAAQAPGRTMEVVVYGNDPCPDRGTASDEIVVCARRPENERYRIPKELRHKGDALSETAWGSRVAGLEEASRPTMPGSCSAVGSYGQTGCTQQMISQWYAARRARRQ